MALTKVNTGGIADDAVTSAKIPANAVTDSELKLDSDYAFTGTVTGAGLNADGAVTINESSNSVDFRVESADDTHAIFVDGSTNYVAIGASNPTRHGQTSKCLILNESGTTSHFALHCGRTGTGTVSILCFSNGNGKIGAVQSNGTNTVYLTTSDYRLKENVSYNFDATSRLKQLKPCRFNFIVDGDDKTQDGFLAHEVESIVPIAVAGEKDAVTEDGTVDPQSLDPSKLVPLLVKTIQELEARITALESA